MLTVGPLHARAQGTQEAQEAQAAAESVQYRVSINGAGDLASLLTENLALSRQQSSTGLPASEVQRLVGITPDQIRALLATEGYFSPSITHTLDRQSSPWDAHFEIKLGPATTIAAVTIDFGGVMTEGSNVDQPRIEKLRGRWSLPVGERFRQSAWDSAKSALLKPLLTLDFPAAAIVQSEAHIDPESHSATLSIKIDSGPRFTFGTLNITGLKRYSRDMIDHLNPIQPGDRYSQEKLNELQARIQDSGYFLSAFATIEIDPAHPTEVPVKLDLSENQRKKLSLGLGFSTDSGPRAEIKWLDRNFLHRDWRLESNLLIDNKTRKLGANVFLPPLKNDWTPSFGTGYEYTDNAGEINSKTLTSARLTSPDKRDESVWAVSLYTDYQRIGDDFSNHREALVGSYIYTRRRVNNIASPTRGHLASIEIDAGPAGLINKKSLVRVVGRATWLSRYYNHFQAILRGQVGQVFGADRDTVPADLLFRTGGDQTVRGYKYNTLGVEQSGAIVGGTVTAVVSAELNYYFTPQWGVAVFTDAGNAADSWDKFRLAQGTGVGARWRSPIGPVNLDLAYGHDTGDIRLHFSIGYGF